MMKKMKDLLFKEEGQALTEYGLIIGLIAVVVIGFVTVLGTEVRQVFSDIITGLGGTPPATN